MRQRALRVLWPSFLMAGIMEILVFAVVDPEQLHWFGGPAIGWSREAIYSVSFLIFWAVITASTVLSLLLMRSPSSINRVPRF